MKAPRQLMRRPAGGSGNALLTAADKVSRTLLEIHGKNPTRDIDWYAYSLLFEDIDNGESQTLSIPIQSDSAFIWTHAVAAVYSVTNGQPFLSYEIVAGGAMPGIPNTPSWPIRVLIRDGGLDRQLMQRATALQAIFGPADAPLELARPRLFKPNSTISVTINRWDEGQRTQAGAATNVDVDVELIWLGYKVFDAERMNLTQ